MDAPIIRFMSRVDQTLYVTGYDGFYLGEITTPAGTSIFPGYKHFINAGRIDWMKHAPGSRAMFYIGLTSTRRDFTCCMQAVGGTFVRTIGLYKGDGVAPDPVFDPRYGHAFPEFRDRDGKGDRIWQYQVDQMPPAQARLLPIMEATAFAGQIFFLKYDLPKLVIAATVRGADGTFASTVQGWVMDQEKDIDPKKDIDQKKDNVVPDQDTLVPIASITKTFTGHLLARMVAQGRARFTDPIDDVPTLGTNPEIRLIDLATHTSGLPRELDPGKPAHLPFVLFPPGTGALYSNVGFNVLGRAIYKRCDTSGDGYGELLKREVLAPLKLDHTSFDPPGWKIDGSDLTRNVFGGHDAPRGQPEHDITPRGASGLYSTPEDILTWLEWHLGTGGDKDDPETRLLNHATWVQRDGLNPVFGLDESGRMDAMGLGWVVMMPEGDRPLILQKAGATRGVFSFVAFSPARGVGFFMSIDRFDIGAATEMPEMIADLIAGCAPR